MTLRAVYQDGMVVLPDSAEIPEGSRLDIRIVRSKRAKKPASAAKPSKQTSSSAKRKTRTLNDRLKSVIGKAKGMPADFAAQHDHYIHGTPKR